MTDGGRANKNGKVLERTIVPVLEEHGFEVVSEVQLRNHASNEWPERSAVRNAKYTTIYGEQGKTEFVLIARNGAKKTSAFPNTSLGKEFRCRVECKRQEVAGSVDEKFPYLVINAEQAYPEEHVIIVTETQGARSGANAWLANAIKQRTYQTNRSKEIVQMSITDFLAWVGRAFG